MSITLARKRDSRRHSTESFSENVVVTEASYQILEVLSFYGQRGLNLLQYALLTYGNMPV